MLPLAALTAVLLLLDGVSAGALTLRAVSLTSVSSRSTSNLVATSTTTEHSSTSTTWLSLQPSSSADDTSGQNVIVIVISQAGPPTPSSLSFNSNNTSTPPSTNALSLLSSMFTIPPVPLASSNPAPSASPSPLPASSSSASPPPPLTPTQSHPSTGLSTTALAGLIVGITLAFLTLLGTLYLLFRYIQQSKERREWEEYQQLSATNGLYGHAHSFGVGGHDDGTGGFANGSEEKTRTTTIGIGSAAGAGGSHRSTRDSLPMRVVRGVSGLAGKRDSELGGGGRASAYSARWGRSHY